MNPPVGLGGEAPGSSEDRTVFNTQKETKNALMVHFSVIPKLYLRCINVQSNTEQELTEIFPIFILLR